MNTGENGFAIDAFKVVFLDSKKDGSSTTDPPPILIFDFYTNRSPRLKVINHLHGSRQAIERANAKFFFLDKGRASNADYSLFLFGAVRNVREMLSKTL